MTRQSAVPYSQTGYSGKRRLKSVKKFSFKLTVYIFTSIFLLDVSAYVSIEQQGIDYFIRIYAVTADGYIHIKSYIRVYHPERNRIRRTEFIINKLFCIKVVYALILTGVSAVCKSFTYSSECIQQSFSETSAEKTGFR